MEATWGCKDEVAPALAHMHEHVPFLQIIGFIHIEGEHIQERDNWERSYGHLSMECACDSVQTQ